jgi:tetratricopeptide (TPR) repeat protein
MADEGDAGAAPRENREGGPPDASAGQAGPRARVKAVARPAGADALRRRVEQAVRLQGAGKLDEALAIYRAVLAEDPYIPASWINLGVLLRRLGHTNPAVACLKRGVALKPYDGSAWSNLGNALRASGRYEEAVRAHERAVELASGSAQLHYNMALSLRDVGHLDASLHAFRRAEMLGYRRPELEWDRALTQLLQGDFETGFKGYEARWRLAEAGRRWSDAPEWDGGPVAGADGKPGPLLVWTEQGFGDTLHFARYLPILKAKGVHPLIFEVQGPLARLFQQAAAFKGIAVVPRGAPRPEPAAQIPLLSLPRLLHTVERTIPASIPYLEAPDSVERPYLPGGVLNVGLCWAGKPTHRNDRNRSAGAAAFVPLLDLPGASFHALQKGPGAQQIADEGLTALVSDFSSRLADFAETAAAVEALDLVITVDTSIGHLAGAMGKEVWVLLPYAPDWRWMLHRDDSPWYPTMTLFRQTSPGDWEEVFQRVRRALSERITEKLRGPQADDSEAGESEDEDPGESAEA